VAYVTLVRSTRFERQISEILPYMTVGSSHGGCKEAAEGDRAHPGNNKASRSITGRLRMTR